MELCKELHERVGELIALCGMDNLDVAMLGLDKEEGEQYKIIYDKIINCIVNMIKKREQLFDVQGELTEIQDKKFLKMIQKEVTQKTANFMRVVPYRKLGKEKRLELIGKTFDIIYMQHENKQFLAEAVGDKELADALYEVLQQSEDAIAYVYVSERRFKEFMAENFYLAEEDLTYIWELYQENLSTVQTVLSLKWKLRIENKVNYLKKRLEYVEDGLKIMCDCMEEE